MLDHTVPNRHFYPSLSLSLSAGLQRAVPVLAVAGQHQEPEAAAVAAQGHPQDLAHPLQGAGRARAAGRLLSESGRLVGAERAGRRPGQLRVLVERVHQSSECRR